MAAEQNLSNHRFFDPPWAFSMLVYLINIFVATWFMFKNFDAHPWLTDWLIFVAVALLITGFRARNKAVTVQDRLIRLEERLRLESLLPADEHALIGRLTLRQVVALRFASDAELPALARRAAAESLDAKSIKRAIVSWRADQHRA